MQRTKSLAMGVAGPRHQLEKTTGVVAVFPQHSKGQSVSHTFQWHSRTLIPRDGAQHLPHNSPEQLRLVEQQCQALSACKSPRAPGPGLRQLQKNLRVQRAHSLGLSSRECTHLSQGCSCGSSGLQPVLYLLQINQFVCTENSPAGAVLRL